MFMVNVMVYINFFFFNFSVEGEKYTAHQKRVVSCNVHTRVVQMGYFCPAVS
jgi:hypothetical protein